jgi:putative transposase
MARQPRIPLAGVPHQVLLRGNNGQAVFVEDDDRRMFVTMLRDATTQCQVVVHGYALLDTRVHLLVTAATDDGIGRAMQSLGRRYVVAFNRRHGRSGTLWEGRFRAHAVGGDTNVLRCLRFIETAALQSTSSRAWSSLPHHLGERRDPLLSDPQAYWRLGNTPFEREAAYRAFVDDGVSESETQVFTGSLTSGRPMGDAKFEEEVESRTGRTLARRGRGRPRKAAAP